MSNVYCVFYMERKYYQGINTELRAKGYKDCYAIIPEIKVLKKAINGKVIYDTAPILFSYGFMRMPVEKAFSRIFLNKMKKDISGIRNWLRSTETLFARKIKRRIDNIEDWDDFSKVAICTKEEVARFRRIARRSKGYSYKNHDIKPGEYITLKVYPYEGIGAIIEKISRKEGKAVLSVYPKMGKMTLTVPLEHVMYSVYSNYDPDEVIRETNLDLNKYDGSTGESLELFNGD